jgi:hypothetical protein
MSTPAQVLEARDKARQLQEELGKPTTPEAAPVETPPGPATAEPVAKEPPAPTADDWRQKYLTLQGMYNSTVPKLQADLKVANQQLTDLRKSLEHQPAAAASAPKQYLTDKDLEDFDKDTIDVMKRAARQEAEAQFGGIIAQLQQQIASLQSTVVPKMTQIEHQATLSREDQFTRSLDGLVPQWRQLNDDNQFLNWLDEVDELSGTPRQELLNAAVQTLDAGRAARFFTQYIRLTAAPVPTPAPTPGASAQLEALVAPGKGRGGAPQSEKPPITRTFIAQFFRDVADKKYSTRPDEKARIEADIFAAQREGRVE